VRADTSCSQFRQHQVVGGAVPFDPVIRLFFFFFVESSKILFAGNANILNFCPSS
jgi:hypothetical protein